MRVLHATKIILAAITGLALVGLSIGSTNIIPGYAVGYLDETNKKFIALPCIEEWRSRSTQNVDIARRGTFDEALKLGYKTDATCREAGGYSADGRSLTGLVLVRMGLLEPIKHWWDMPYRTEDGRVVNPSKSSN